MGCVSSKPDINDQHPNIFQVSNVNDQGEPVGLGQLEVTETELVLHQRGKNSIIWPLKALRKYGFDSEIFSFESGRRCPTGQGIYAFRCRKAEQLFNLVQHNIAHNSIEDAMLSVLTPNSSEFPVPAMSTGPPVQMRVLPSQLPEDYLNPVGSTTSFRPNGPASPVLPTSDEHNNNYTNVTAISPSEGGPDVLDSPGHLYMNVNTTKANESEEDSRHCYANIDTKVLERLKPLLKSSFETPLPSVPQTPTALYLTVQEEVSYAELDLNPKMETNCVSTAVETPKKSYATIDFQRTNALSQSINPPIEVEEGSRKTRHNSTINDVTTRHSNSLSD